MEFKVTNFSDAKLIRLVDFYREMVGGVFQSTKRGYQFLEKILLKPHFDPKRDLFIAEKGDTIVGLLFILSEHRIGRILLNCYIHHNSPYQKVASALWRRGIYRCEEIGGEKIHVCLHENFRAARDFFTQNGFSPVRVHLELERDLEGVLKLTEEPEIGQVAHFDEGDEPLLAELQNRIFAGSWGFCPNSAEEIKHYLDLTQCQVRDVLLLKDGNKVIGYLWSHASIGGDSALKSGRIHMFGINEEFQGQGFGKKLLRIGLEDMKKKGFGIVELTADEENHPAIALYDTFDFREKFTSIWYEKLNKC